MHSLFIKMMISTSIICCFLLFFSVFSCSDDENNETFSPTPTQQQTQTPTATTTPTPTPYADGGTLFVGTTPVSGDIFIDGRLAGNGFWRGYLPVGTYSVSFGHVSGYFTPEPVEALIEKNSSIEVEGLYLENCYLTEILINGVPWYGETYIEYSSLIEIEIQFLFSNGLSWIARTHYEGLSCPDGVTGATVCSGSTGVNTIYFIRPAVYATWGTIYIDGYLEGGQHACWVRIPYFHGGP